MTNETKRRKRPDRMGVLNSEEHVPPGFVPLSSIKSEDGAKGLVCYITRKCNSGEVDSYCIKAASGRTRKLYVHGQDIETLEAEYARTSSERCDRSEESAADSLRDTLQSLLHSLEGLHEKIDRLM